MNGLMDGHKVLEEVWGFDIDELTSDGAVARAANVSVTVTATSHETHRIPGHHDALQFGSDPLDLDDVDAAVQTANEQHRKRELQEVQEVGSMTGPPSKKRATVDLSAEKDRRIDVSKLHEAPFRSAPSATKSASSAHPNSATPAKVPLSFLLSSPPHFPHLDTSSSSPAMNPLLKLNASRHSDSDRVQPSLPKLVPFMPDEYSRILRNRGINSLHSWQADLLLSNRAYYLHDRHLVYASPTSAGKSLVAETLLMHAVTSEDAMGLLVLPFISICEEKFTSLSVFGRELNFDVEIYAGSRGSFPPPKGGRIILIATMEMATAIVSALMEEERLSELRCVVVDELHMIGDGSTRGALLEALLVKLRLWQKKHRNSSNSQGAPLMQIIGMSATLPNLQQVADWLEADIYEGNFRPVPLEEHVIFPWEKDLRIYTLDRRAWLPLDLSVIKNYDPKRKYQPEALCLAALAVGDFSALIFCNSKRMCEGTAQLLRGLLPAEDDPRLVRERSQLVAQIEYEINTKMESVQREGILHAGIAYHHSGLSMHERRLIEDGFRKRSIRLLCCTSTLAAGVNLPVRRVIFRGLTVGMDTPLTASKYAQMAGRAGRAGLDTKGESFVVARHSDMHILTGIVSTRNLRSSEPMYSSFLQLSAPSQVPVASHATQATQATHVSTSASSSSAPPSFAQASTLLKTPGPTGGTVPSLQVPDSSSVVSPLGTPAVSRRSTDGAADSMVIPDEVLPLQRLLLDSIITGLIDIQKGRSAVLDFLDSTLFYRQTADDRRDKWFQTIQACLLSLVGRQFLAPDDSASSQGYVIRPLGLATVKSSFPLEDALFLHSELARAMKTGLFLDGELHLCYLTTPLQAMIDPDWKLYARLLNRLPEEEQKIFERCGCDPTLVSSYAYRPPSHSSSSSAPPAAASALLRDQDRQLLCCRRFWNALILRDLINEVPVEEVCPKYNASMGAVEFLMSAAGSFTNQMVRFCERMEWWSLEACLKAYAQRFEFGSKMDVVELCGIRGIGSKRARILFRHGIRTVDAVARMSKEALTRKLGQMIDADMILASAVQICQSRARRAAFEARRLIESLTQSELRGVEDYDPVAMEHAEFVKTQLPSAAALPVVGKVPHP